MIQKNNVSITDVDMWGELAGPKEKIHWKEHRSAMETAKAWLNDKNQKLLPPEVQNILESHKDFAKVLRWRAEPEALVSFDSYSGPANMDLLVHTEDEKGEFVIGVEAKADEPFSKQIKDIFADALERKLENTRSNGLARVAELAEVLFSKKGKGTTKVGDLRYQLLTGTAGTLTAAQDSGCKRAVFLIHEFKTPATKDEKHQQNQNDLNAFVHRLSNGIITEVESDKLYGPFNVRGNLKFGKSDLYIGKVVRNVTN